MEIYVGIIRKCGVRDRQVRLVSLFLIATVNSSHSSLSYLGRGRLCFFTPLSFSSAYFINAFTSSKKLVILIDRHINLLLWRGRAREGSHESHWTIPDWRHIYLPIQAPCRAHETESASRPVRVLLSYKCRYLLNVPVVPKT